MGLTIAMQSAISGLNAAQLALQITSANVTNANTPGYTRKTMDLETRILNGMGAGVLTNNVLRNVDLDLQRQMRLQSSDASQYTTLGTYYDQMQHLFGNLDDNSTSYVTSISSFENALQSLGLNPDGVSQRIDVLNSAQNLTAQLASVGRELQDMRSQADNAIAGAVQTVNDQLEIVDQLNKQISRGIGLNQAVGDLQDKRDLAIDTIAKKLDITYFTQGNGEVIIFTKGGRPLVDAEPQVMSHSPSSSMSATVSYANGSVDGIYLRGTDITSEIKGGEIGALINLRDSRIPGIVAELDRLGEGLRDEINAIHNDGTAFPPPNSLTGSHQFVAGDTLVANGNIRIALTDSSGRYVDDGGGNPAYADIDLTQLTAAVGGTLTVQNVIDAVNGGVIPGFAGVPGVQASLINGNMVVKSTNPLYGVIVDSSDVDGSLGTNGSVDVSNVTLAGDITAFPAPTIQLATDGISPAAGTALQALLVNGDLNLNVETTAGGPGAVQLSANANFAFGPVGGGAGSSLGLATATASADLAAGGTVEVSMDSDADGISDTVIGTITFGAITLAGVTAGGAQGSIAIQGIDITNDATVQVAGTSQSFNQFFGLNDFFTTGTDYDAYSSSVQADSSTPVNVAGTLSFSGIFGGTTVNYLATDDMTTIAAAINADVNLQAANISAQIIPEDGGRARLLISDSDGNNFSLTDSGSLLGNLDVRTDTTGISQAMQVRQSLINDPTRIARGRMDNVNAPAIGAAAVAAGDGSAVQDMAYAFTSQIRFPASGGLATTTTTLGGYGASILSLNAVQAANVESTRTFKSSIVTQLQTKLSSQSGVNIDEELAQMIMFQNAYAASARVISTASHMFDILNDIM